MVPYLQKEIFGPEDIPVFKRGFFCFLGAAVQQVSVHFSRKACGEGDQPFMVRAENFFVYPRFIIKSFKTGFSDKLDKIFPARVVFCEEDKMEIPLAGF